MGNELSKDKKGKKQDKQKDTKQAQKKQEVEKPEQENPTESGSPVQCYVCISHWKIYILIFYSDTVQWSTLKYNIQINNLHTWCLLCFITFII